MEISVWIVGEIVDSDITTDVRLDFLFKGYDIFLRLNCK